MTVRSRCLRCWRPATLCWCRALVPIATRTRVVFLQHPRERTMAMGTARIAHVALANSELHVGVRFDDHPRVRALVEDPGANALLLYPDRTADEGGPIALAPARTLVVLDGTWITARKMLARNPTLAGLPRLALAPRRPSTYRIRREPASHCLSTVEAVAAALEHLEGDAERLRPMLDAFDALVTAQLRYAATRRRPFRRERKHHRRRRWSAVETLLRTRGEDVVLIQAEGNPHDGLPHELVHLVAERPATGERLSLLVAPRHALGPRTAGNLRLEAAALQSGASIAAALAAWEAFVRPTDVLCGWGRFTPSVLEAEGAAARPWVDLRGEVARWLSARAGGAEGAAIGLGASAAPPWAPGRAGRRVAALAAVVERLRRSDPSATPYSVEAG